ncbi:hypothetical protein BamMEX5DRAFT_4167 [Burkholderia ambifaria MEX-5]|uniref:Uncharacterized protein n=1 Tax=Burkholderia ambifaria MEX-5 TaxID=396597 RepID=B1T8Q1_9BURK|nr:hypothetical protein BamMEX5DRAFT_4167 [Burkholderia ambifaria MEX-5]
MSAQKRRVSTWLSQDGVTPKMGIAGQKGQPPKFAA